MFLSFKAPVSSITRQYACDLYLHASKLLLETQHSFEVQQLWAREEQTPSVAAALLIHHFLMTPSAHSKDGCLWQRESVGEGGWKKQTFLFIVRLLPAPAQAVQRLHHLARKLVLLAAMLRPQGVLLLLVVVVIQDGGLADGHANDRGVGLQA